ncbi:MAG: hypothetical protein R3246_15690, partial [Acidimicrobiia bacterium]|nr:hypothetical protein [Acidimicrobiia bacterium]
MPIEEEIVLTTIPFTTLVFPIREVPVSIKPMLTITTGIEGELEATATFTATEYARTVAGVEYHDDEWGNLSDLDFDFWDAEADLDGRARVEGYLAAHFDLLFYGLVGPYSEVVASLELEGTPSTWGLDGCLRGSAGINTTRWLDLEYGVEVFAACKRFAGNEPPTVRIVNPEPGDTVQIGLPVDLWALATDPDGGGSHCCTYSWESSVDGWLGSGSSFDYTFPTPGTRTITVTATDSDGATGTRAVTVDVENRPPTVRIARPTADEELHARETVLLRGTGFDINEPNVELGCDQLVWTSSRSSDPFPVSGCEVEVVFPSAGTRTLTLTGTDSHGATDTARVTIAVLEERENLPPVVRIESPAERESVGPDERITLRGRASDPEGEELGSFRWTLNVNGQS